MLDWICIKRHMRHQPLQFGDQLLSSESDVCRRQILTTKVDPSTGREEIGIQMKQKELTKPFMMISN